MATRPLFGEPKIATRFHSDESIILHHGDALTFLRDVPPKQISLVVTSPPYNLGKVYERKRALEIYLEEQATVIAELVRSLKDNGSICWEVGNFVDDGEVFPLDFFFYDIFKKNGLRLRNRIIWHFGHGLHGSRRFSGRYETILWFTKADNYVFNLDTIRVPSKYPGKKAYKGPNIGKPSGNPLGKNPSDVWEVVRRDWETGLWDIPNVKSNHPEKTIHPCQFPIELVERCVLALTNEGEWVLDPYVGVGSTLIAGIKHSRKVIGCEKEAAYVKTCRERIGRYFAGELGIRKLGRPVYEPTGREKVSRVPQEWIDSTGGNGR